MEVQCGMPDVLSAVSRRDVAMVTDLVRRGADVNQGADERGYGALHLSCESGHLEMVHLLCKRGAQVNCQSKDGTTPLHVAIRKGHVTIVRFLLDQGADHSMPDESDCTPLTLALSRGDDVTRSIVINHCDTSRAIQGRGPRDRRVVSPLQVAIRKDDVKAVEFLLLRGRHGGDDSVEKKIRESGRNGFTALHWAAQYNSRDAAKLLIGFGADVNFPAYHSITPLHVASRWGHQEMADLLIGENALIESCTKDKLTPLHCACRNGQTGVANILLERGARVLAKTKNLLSPLHMAVQGDHVTTCQLLLRHFANVDDATYDLLTPLHVAAHCGNYSVAKFLLNSGCLVDPRARNGFTPLHVACKKNRKRIIELLLRFGADVEIASESGLTPLHVSSFLGHLEIARRLLDEGAQVDCRNMRLESPVHLATRGGNVAVVELLLDRGANVNSQAKELQTPMHYASHMNHVRLMELLLDEGASVDPQTTDGHTPMHLAAAQDNEDAILCLLRRGADPSLVSKKGFTALHLASKYDKGRSARMLLAGGCDPNSRGINDLTPLLLASHYGCHDIVQLLLKYGADVGMAALNGYSALHVAAKKNRLQIAEELLRWGVDVNAKSKNGFSPLHLACRQGHQLMVQLLLDHGADVNCPSANGLTPLHLVARENRVSVAEMLVLYKASVNPRTLAGYTPLHTACHFGHVEMINFLLSHNADPNIQNKYGFTSLHQAAQEGHVMVVNLLLRFKADPNLLSSNGSTALSIANRLNFLSLAEVLRTVTKKLRTVHENSNVPYSPTAPETMQEYDVIHPEELYEKNIYNQIDSQSCGMTPCSNGRTDQARGDGKPEKRYHHSMDFMVDEMVLADELRYTEEHPGSPATIASTANTTPSDLMVADGPDISSQFSDALEVKVEERSTNEKGHRTLPHKHGKNKTLKSGIFKRGKSAPVATGPREGEGGMSCDLMHPSELSTLPLLGEDQAFASWVVHCRPAGKSFSRPVIIIMPYFSSLHHGEREVAIYESPNGLDWLEHVGPTVLEDRDCTGAVLKPTFRGVNLKNDLYTRHLIGITALVLPRYFILVSRVSESRLLTHHPGSILRPPSDKHPVFVTIGQHGCTPELLDGFSLSVQNIPREFSLKGDRSFSCTPCVTVRPLDENFAFPLTLTLSSFVLLSSEKSGQLRLYVRRSDGHWYDVSDETAFDMNESNTVVTFPLKHGGRYIMTNGSCNEMTLNSMTSQLSLVPFHARFLLFCRASSIRSGWLEFDVFCGTSDVIDGFVEEENNLNKIELYRSEELEVYNNTFQIFTLKGGLFEVSDESSDRVFFQAFQRNFTTVTAKALDHLSPDKGSMEDFFKGAIAVSTLVPTDGQIFFTIPVCQSNFSFSKGDQAEQTLWYPFIGHGLVSPREQLPPLASYIPPEVQDPVKVDFDEYDNTVRLQSSDEVIRYEYKEEVEVSEPTTESTDVLNDDGSVCRVETFAVSTFRVVYRFRDDNETKELVEKKPCSVDVVEKVSRFPPGLKPDDAGLDDLKFITSEKNVVEVGAGDVPVNKKIVTRVYRAPKPKVLSSFTEGEVVAESSFVEEVQELEDGSAVKSKRVKTVHVRPVSEEVFVNGVLKSCRTENKTIKTEVEDYSIKLPNAFLTPKLGMWSLNVDFKKPTEISGAVVPEIGSELFVEVVPGRDCGQSDVDLRLESLKKSKVDMIIKGPVECKIEKMTSDRLVDFDVLVRLERTVLTYVLPCYEVRVIAMAEKKKIVSEEVIRVDVIENIIELPPNYRDLDYERISFETTSSFTESATDSGSTCKKKTFVTRLSPSNVVLRDGQEHPTKSFTCPVECQVKVTGKDRFVDVDDAFEYNRTVETRLVQPIAKLTYNRDSLPALTLEYVEMEADLRDVFVRLECGNVERHAGNCDVSIIVVPSAPAAKEQEVKGKTLKRVVFDVKLRPPRTMTKCTEGDLQVRNKMEEFVKVSEDGKVKSHFKVITSEHFKPITITTMVNGKVAHVEKSEQLVLTSVKENVFELPILALDVAGSDVDICTTEDKFKEPVSNSWVNKTSTKISLVPQNGRKKNADKNAEPEILREEFEFEDASLDGTTTKHVVTIESFVVRDRCGDECRIIEQKVTENVLEIPSDVAHLDDHQICSKTTDSWSQETTPAGVAMTKHVVKTRLYNKSDDFDYDPVSKNVKLQEELEGDVQIRTDVQEFVKFSNDARIKHKIITRKYIKPVTVVKSRVGRLAPEITVREDLVKVEIEEYAMELDDDLCLPDDCVSTIDNYTYVNYLPNGIPVNTEVTKITAKLKKDRQKVEEMSPLSQDLKDGKNIKQKVSLVENQSLQSDGSIMKTKTMTKDCFEIHKKINSRGEVLLCENLLKTEIKEFVMILPRGKIDVYACNCNLEISSELTKIARKEEPQVSKLIVTARVGLKVDSKHLVLSCNEVPKYSFGITYGEAIIKEIVEYEERSNEPCVERIRRSIFIKSRPFYTLVLDDGGNEHRVLSGNKVEQIRTIECMLQSLAEDVSLGFGRVEIKSCRSEESNHSEDGVPNELVKIVCVLGKADSEVAKDSCILEEKVEKRVDVLKEEDELRPNGSLKRSVTYAHRYFKVLNTVRLSPQLYLELESSENMLECNLVTVDVVLSPCTINDEEDCVIEMKTLNDWEEVSDDTRSQHVEICLPEPHEFTFSDAKLLRKTFESEKETFLFDETLIKWKTLTRQTFLTCSECQKQSSDLETVKSRSILLRTDIFVLIVEVGPEVVIDDLKREFECLLSNDRSYLLMSDGSLCYKSSTKCVIKKALEINKLNGKQARRKKSLNDNSSDTLEDGTLIFRNACTTCDVQPYYKIAEDQQPMLCEDILSKNIQEVLVFVRPEVKKVFNDASMPVRFVLRDEVETFKNRTTKRRTITCESGKENCEYGDIKSLCGDLESEDDEIEEQCEQQPGFISMTKTWIKSLNKLQTDIQFGKGESSLSVTNRKLELYRDSLKTSFRLPIGLLDPRNCRVSISFDGGESCDGSAHSRQMIMEVELTSISDADRKEGRPGSDLRKVNITTDSNESGTQSRKSELITTEILPDGSVGKRKVVTTLFFKKRLETVYVDGIETTSREEEIPIETVEETHLLHLPFEMDETDLCDWDTEVTEVKDEGEKHLDGINMKYRTIHMKLSPRSGRTNDEIEQEIVEGEVQSKSVVAETQETFEDGSVLKKKVITISFVKPVTKVTSRNGRVIGLTTYEQSLGTEVEEIHLHLPPGHIEPFGHNLITETTVHDSNGMPGDQTPTRRKVIKMKVTLQDSDAQTVGAQTDVPYPLDSSKRIEGKLVTSTTFSESSSSNEDGDRTISKTTSTRFFRPVAQISISNGSITTASISEETSHINVCETVTILSSGIESPGDPDVITISTEEAFDERNSENIPISKIVKTNKLYKVRGPSKAFESEKENVRSLSSLKSTHPQLFLEGHEIDDSIKIFAQLVENEPTRNVKIQEFVDILPDGTKVKRRVTETIQKRTIKRKLAIGGGVSLRAALQATFLNDSLLALKSEPVDEEERTGQYESALPFPEPGVAKKLSRSSRRKEFTSETSFTTDDQGGDVADFYDS